MKTVIRPMGNSRGVIIPKPLIEEAGLGEEVDMTVENGAIVIRKPAKPARAGWAEAAQRIAEVGDDALVLPEFANEEDSRLES